MGRSPAHKVLSFVKKAGISSFEGFLSYDTGIIPCETPPLLNMQGKYTVWDDVAESLPYYIDNLQERMILNSLPVLLACEETLDDIYLSRAAVLLGSFAHAYYFNQRGSHETDPLPDSIEKPWKEVCRRLGRPVIARTMADAFYYNWKFKEGADSKEMSLDNLELLVPIVNDNSEKLFNLTVLLLDYYFAEAMRAIVNAQNAVLDKDDKALLASLSTIVKVINYLTEKTFLDINPNRYSRYFIDPSSWSKTFAILAEGIREEEPGLTGASSPMFHILDSFIGRKKYEGSMGGKILSTRALVPQSHLEFICAVSEISVSKYIAEQKNLPYRRCGKV